MQRKRGFQRSFTDRLQSLKELKFLENMHNYLLIPRVRREAQYQSHWRLLNLQYLFCFVLVGENELLIQN